MSQIDISHFLDFGDSGLYRKLDIAPGRERKGRLEIDTAGLAELSRLAFSDIAFKFPRGHLELLAGILADGRASENEKFVAETLLRNAAVAAEGVLPLCQDTGSILIYGWKGDRVETFASGGTARAEVGAAAEPKAEKSAESESAALARGAALAYVEKRLRKSQLGPESALSEKNTGDNLPALVDVRAAQGQSYRFLFVAKGGGSTSKTSLSMESPAILNEAALRKTLEVRIRALGAAACPPYTIAAVLGGVSPSQTLYAMELAAYGLLDRLPAGASADGSPLRDRDWEKTTAALAAETGIGAQWGGRHLAVETRFIRLSRHAANLPLALGVSCAAHRKARAFVDKNGWFLEKMEEDPARFLPASRAVLPGAVEIDFDAPREEWQNTLRGLRPGTPLSLSGTVTLARDAAHARIAAAVRGGQPLPDYFSRHPIFYAGPTEAPPDAATGSFGPTTAARMDSYLPFFLGRGASLVTIAKGSRGPEAAAAIAAAGGAYIACIGGAAAITARDHVAESKIVDHADLGMEAVRLARLKALPALLVIDARGSNFYA